MRPNDTVIYYINRVYAKGLTTTSGGNLSVMDGEGNIWITPSGKDKGTLCSEDICCVRPDGTVCGKFKPSIELPFHSLIYKLRPDVKAVLHVHSPALVTYSLFNSAPRTDILPSAYAACGKIGLSKYDIPGSIELGRQIAEVINKGYDSIMMENHGVVLVAKDMATCYDRLETLENCAEINLNAMALGGEMISLSAAELKKARKRAAYEYTERTEVGEREAELRREICAFSKRCYAHGFFTVNGGVISAKIDDGSFLITPKKYDRATLKPSQIVKVTDGKCEKGRKADGNYALHARIYEGKEYVKSIFQATSPNVMAYAVTGEEIDSRTIPESYINMRDIVRVPYGKMEENISALSPATPNVLVDNEYLLATGESIVKAFDRVEVSEVTAMTLVKSRVLGKPSRICDAEIEKIDDCFNLPKKSEGRKL